jgi:hypothetical protein
LASIHCTCLCLWSWPGTTPHPPSTRPFHHSTLHPLAAHAILAAILDCILLHRRHLGLDLTLATAAITTIIITILPF